MTDQTMTMMMLIAQMVILATAMMMTAVVDAVEERDVATINVPNTFVQTDLPKADPGDQAIVKMRGKLALLMVQTNPQLHQKHVTIEKGQPVLCVELLKAL